ncbi:RNA polymerase sigma-70 factor [Rhodobacter sp. JA431]|uniref:sigma-70 family RNA polymerase sigma factor n=1 Tax=Rhodobacter sp. JA431 TaxID=570013 RepID=UPI000BCC9340|nr:sigma-70 family RNA polymerase sigma factor [Rhodobacter sp. JA431]SOC00116.1 RNA polymerase sigma-70 factor [Rhodobacter sp. JA431]
MVEHDDWETLLRRANAGDGAALAQFLRAVSPSIRTILRARGAGLPVDQQEDVLQEVLLAIHLKRHTWQPDAPVRPWVHAIARYKLIDACRRRGAAIHVPIDPFAETLADPHQRVPLAGRDAEQLLAQIDPRSAALVRAVAIEGESAEAAGAPLGLTGGAARVALHRALKRLRQIVKG